MKNQIPNPMPPFYEIIASYVTELKFLAYYFIITSFGFVAPIKVPFIGICFLMAMDMFTALCYTYKEESKDFWDFWQNQFTSDKMRGTLWKLLLYTTILIALFVAEKFIFVEENIVKPGTWLLAARETKSIIENVDKTLKTNILKGITDIFSKLTSKS